MPESKNYEAALNGLDASVSRLLGAGKRVILLIDNPTLPHPEDCLARKTSSSFFNELLATRLNPSCQITISSQMALSKKYRDMLLAIQRRHPNKVSLFDTIPILCNEKVGVCTPTKNGRFLYGNTDHISEYGSRLVGQQLNFQLYPEGEGLAKVSGLVNVSNWGPKETIAGQIVNKQPDGTSAMWIKGDIIGNTGQKFVNFGNKGIRSVAHVKQHGITAQIPAEVIRNPGNYRISIVEEAGRRIEVGTFTVHSRP